ncbi:ribonuclease Z [Mycolicibacterium fortuitum]|uniref:Ribonuclease Z n=2 Tax=Mycolicibacterium fortuitum TaxID=1766 RepID=A0A0N9XDS7_MYCFO|nr:ribonuclease Z [Mycolicibacterium fortuitum]ALI24306.1 Ribonuclease Z [Mycolicibacterium fortuitum]MCV7139427.1 ribonuclease Z [Mycolicibacterium fortuitum]MDV7191608.1 ribonuclease Z [Mycolicibacterium fortuitum]MDV7204731.1 ribonuclease Z [Mycolicibacterium fortuitum]MDV7225602.1 ribonuclease Z [Mycolicibacterium fortuitum]
MSLRELIVLGTASQVPTRHRNHNGYLLRWDGEGLLFDPGEGTQRQLLFAGVAASAVTRLCLTHFHGDHCLGVPGVLQRMSLDRAPHPLHVHYPDSGRQYFTRLRHASVFHDTLEVHEHPITADGPVADGGFGLLEARQLDHSVDSFGYRFVEPDGRRMVPELLARFGVTGPAVGELQRTGEVRTAGERVRLQDVSEIRRGQRFAFVMDTRLCDAAFALAEDADLLVIEATFLHRDAQLASRYGHLTARQAAHVAAQSGVRRLVLTHFSQRYDDARQHRDEAAEVFDGEVITAHDLARIPVPKRA